MYKREKPSDFFFWCVGLCVKEEIKEDINAEALAFALKQQMCVSAIY